MTQRVSRRDLVNAGLVAAAGVAISGDLLAQAAKPAKAKAPATPPPELQPLNRYPHMVQEYYVQRVRAIEKASLQRKAGLRTADDARAYVDDVRQRIRRCFGPEPERTPLNPRITGTLDRDAYTIEKVIFDSRPDFPVTANLYLPKGRKLPAPGVVGTCGHSNEGKAGGTYQSFAQGLARLGYVVLIYDPIGQGERFQLVKENLKPRVGAGVSEHLYTGNPQFLVGEFFGAWRAWDGVRALDYLLTRPEVDKNHLGLTGNSGGGTMTTWIIGLDHRYTMAAPGCFVTTVRRDFENELPQDTEQCPPRMLAQGLDHDDFLAALAPKPVTILAKEKDFFDVRGAEEIHGRLRRLYRLLGREEDTGLFIGPTYHGYTQENREAMYRWFNRATGISDATTEPPLTMEKQETLWCTPHGQVAEFKPRHIMSFTSEKSRALAKRRGRVSGPALLTAVRDVLKVAPPSAEPDYRILRTLATRRYPTRNACWYAVETEPGIQSIVTRLSDEPLISRLPRGSERAVLYVSHQSADAELRDEPLVKELLAAEKDVPFFAMDVRGVGDTQPDTCGTASHNKPYGSDYFYAAYSNMLDEPYLGRKVHDVLGVLAVLRGAGHTQVHLAGNGWGSLCAAFAALLSDQVTQVTLKHALTSYADIAESEDYAFPLSGMPLGVLERFDLPDVYAALEAKGLRQVEPWNQKSENV